MHNVATQDQQQPGQRARCRVPDFDRRPLRVMETVEVKDLICRSDLRVGAFEGTRAAHRALAVAMRRGMNGGEVGRPPDASPHQPEPGDAG